MPLNKIQKRVDEWTSQFDPQYWTAHQIFVRLSEEVGELAREINHLDGPKPKKPTEQTKELGEEIADIIFTLCCLANSKGINLNKAFDDMMRKYIERDNDRYKKK